MSVKLGLCCMTGWGPVGSNYLNSVTAHQAVSEQTKKGVTSQDRIINSYYHEEIELILHNGDKDILGNQGIHWIPFGASNNNHEKAIAATIDWLQNSREGMKV